MMRVLKSRRAALVVAMFAALWITAYAYRGADPASFAAGPQDTMHLERRISQLEQRFYSIEAGIRRLEQAAAFYERQSAAQPVGRDATEAALLRAELDALRRRVSEVECGLAKLDERTLGREAREARGRAGAAASDPCRLDPQGALRLSTRP